MPSLPLFPRDAVLYPGGTARLRIVERRHLDMVRNCGHSDGGFGVCLILKSTGAGTPVVPAAVGTHVRIVDFHTRPDGLLELCVQGNGRFRVERARVRDSGLIVGDVRWLPDDESQVVPPQHGLLARLLEHVLERQGRLPDDARLMDDRAWVGWRLAEILPLDACDRQRLLQLDDPVRRLDTLAEWLPRLSGGT